MALARVSILGATGYGGGDLLRLLLRHPHVEVVHVTSRTAAGKSVGEVHRNLDGWTDLRFSSPTEDELLAAGDVIFGALPHAASAEQLGPLVLRGARVIDLSGDFRLRDGEAYRKGYQHEPPLAEVQSRFVYGAPELNRDAIRRTQCVACPGCYATSLNLALLPLARAGWLRGTPVATGLTGSSGAGAEPGHGTHHPTRSQTLRPYKVLEHQHVVEVVQTLRDAGSDVGWIDFTPISTPIVRGILSTVVARLHAPRTTAELSELYAADYAGDPFVRIQRTREPECGAVARTNRAEVRVRATPAGDAHIVCAIDNLVKGAAGQAVQCLNLMMGWDERTGLDGLGSWP